MSHTYTNILIHALFSTKDRQPWLVPEMRDETFNYLGGAVNALGRQSLLVNGPVDHLHMLFVQPRTLSIADLMGKGRPTAGSPWAKGCRPLHGLIQWPPSLNVTMRLILTPMMQTPCPPQFHGDIASMTPPNRTLKTKPLGY
jgi:hypothetical protein